ncbi:MAG: hypothetical protein H6811_07805 [Phycisphaeraceae bacterium]|nr:hypothetical protein [Phycisphaeraceae bacterium]
MRTLFVALLAASVVSIGLCGCGKGEPAAPPPLTLDLSSPATAARSFVLAVLRRDVDALAQCISSGATDETLVAARAESASDAQLSALARRVREGTRADREPRIEGEQATVFMDGMNDLTLSLEDGDWRVLELVSDS